MADYTGTAGNDTLAGSSGPDTLIGLAGDDRYHVNHLGDIVREAANEGYDRVLASLSYVLNADAYVEMLTTADNLGTAAINLTGNGLSQYIYGNAGSNRLDGGGGGDVMVGLQGDDFYVVRHVSDRAVEAAGQGFDRVLAAASFRLEAGSAVEMFTTIDNLATTAINLTGNNLAQYLYGNAGSNRLDGGGGGDVMLGLGGDDLYVVRGASDRVSEAAGEGFDRVSAGISWTLTGGASVEMLTTVDNLATTAIDLTGNGLSQYIYGNAGANRLDGGGGGDVMLGLGGDDRYFVRSASDRVSEATGEGFDRVLAAAAYVLSAGAHVEMLTTTDNLGSAAIDLTGNEIGQSVYGNAGANRLDGGRGADSLTGFGGPDDFAFTSQLGGGNVDTVFDFQVALDTILLGGGGGQPFAALASGSLRADAFRIGSGALDADDYLIYNSATGALLYDSDGNGASPATRFATLSTGLALTAADFTVSGPANNSPTITSPTIASVPENSPTTTIVYQAAAGDSGGDRITWSLTGIDAAALEIDPITGAVRLEDSPDFEAKSSYDFTIVARDSGSSTSRVVRLNISDVNEATPIINETPSSNDAVASAQAIDRAVLRVAENANLPDDALPSATIVGNLPLFEDRDFFSIALQAGEKLILDVDNSGDNLDTHVRVYRSDGEQIGENDDPEGPDPGSAPHPEYDHNTDSLFSFRATTAGLYYFSIEPFQDEDNPTFGSYELHVSIGPPATPAELIQEDIEALISGLKWTHDNLSFSFPTLASQYPSDFPEVNPAGDLHPFTSFQQAATRQLFQLIANVSELTFAERSGGTDMTSGAGSADLRFAMSTDPEVVVAYASFPTNQGPTSAGGTAWFNTEDFNNPIRGNYAWMGILHEAGHTLGLKHGHEAPAVRPEFDSIEYTVMTYRSYPGQDLSGGGGYTNETWGYAQTLMMYDIAALQQMYGPNWAFNAGNSVYRWSPTTGEMSINGIGQGAPGNGAGGSANRIFMTIWDGGGNDTYDLSNYTGTAKVIDLRPGEWSRLDPLQEANLGNSHFARGNVANALLFGDDPRSLIENAIGSTVTDHIIANQAANRLTGNADDDFFRWESASDAGTGAFADTITDFARDSDLLDFRGLDANPATGTHDAFSFIGTSAFHNVAGEVRYDVVGGSAHVFADVNGNGTADMEIILTNVTTLAVTDFTF